MDISITSFKQGIIRYNNVPNLVCRQGIVEKNVDKEMIITSITCLILESTSTSDYYDINRGVSKSTRLEPTIKKLNERNKPLPVW